ncbi:MAG TPA: hypothetical protein VNW73_11595 [Ktedonobacteraceae bacterium]|nr:hypothetical protein [Ktedonobacteraceae bacterium]
MIILLLALIGALIVMAILSIGRLAFGRRELFIARSFARWFIGYFIFNYIFCLFILYVSEPALTGPFGGWQWILLPLVISSIANLFVFVRPLLGSLEDVAAASQGRRSGRSSPINLPTETSRGVIAAGIFGLVVAATIGIVVAGLIVVFTTWFDTNAKALAAIPNVKVETQTTPLIATDPNHIVLVSQSVAAFKGQQILGSNGQNLGSSYSIDPASYTLQSISHHLYYVAPLSYNNIFINLSNSSTPGFVVVDAENPNAQPTLHTAPGDSIAYLPGAIFNQDLIRHVYLSGYTYARLVDPTLELDDSFHPYWTISLMQPTRGYTGDVLSQVLIVNAHTGDITIYQPNRVPLWVDRVMPSDTVTQYLTWWGLYHAAPWFNPSGAGQQSPVTPPQLLYNNVDQPVWLIAMTSSSANDNSSTGVFLFDTHKNEAHFYPGAAGIGIGDNVANTFQSTRANILRYNVDTSQLYQICGQPTWVAIYSSNSIFQDVGILDAKNLNGSNVQFETNLPAALSDYKLWLTQQGIPNACVSTNIGGTQQTVTGKVLRISVTQQSGNTIYYLQISGQNVIFTANLGLSPKLPLVQPGDTVIGTYSSTSVQTGQPVNLKTFDDLTIKLGGLSPPTPTPGTGTPVATPTASATP